MITSFFKPKTDAADKSAARDDVSPVEPPAGSSTPDGAPKDAAAAAMTETEVQAPGRKRLRKAAVIRDDDEDEEEDAADAAPAEDMDAADGDGRPTGDETAAPAAASSSLQAYFKGRPTGASPPGAAKPSASAGGDAPVNETTAPPAAAPAAAPKKKAEQKTLDGGSAGGKPSSSGAKRVGTSLLDLKAYLSYDPAAAATWGAGEDIPFAFLANAFVAIEAESKRLLITQLMCNAFRTVIATSPEQLHATICVATNKIAASYEGLELGVGDSIMIKAVAETCGKSVESVKAQLEEEGDLGAVAMAARRKQITFSKPKPLTVRGVLAAFVELARSSGKDVMTRKKEKIKSMLVAAQGAEAQYIVRACQGKMRLGLAEATVLTALAHAVVLSPPPLSADATAAATAAAAAAGEEDAPFWPGQPGGPGGVLPKGEALVRLLDDAVSTVKQVYCELPNYAKISEVLLSHGLAQLHKHAHLTAGIPVKPMLAKPTKGISEVLDRMGSGGFTCEFKYDGERAQVHMLPDGTVKVFSRNSEDMTSKYPDLAAVVPRATADGVSSFIIDAEAVAVDRETGEIRPFQVLSTRKRKDASVDNITVQVCLFAFDLLYLNGEPLLRKPLAERRDALKASFRVLPAEFDFAKASDPTDEDAIADWLQQAIKGNCEGLMVKTLQSDATYEPSKRSLSWLKVKKDYLQGMTDSCDLVPIGAYHGKGKRTGVFGAYLLACYNEEEEEYQSVCKIGTGFSDAALAELTDALRPKMIDAPPKYYRTPDWADNSMPDVWFEPAQVWEVLAADLSISPVHQAAVGLVDAAKGIALRFPRFLRVRDDKGPEDATNATQIAQMYNDQACTKGAAELEDEDDY